MNTEYMNLLNQTIITTLADDINKKLKEENKQQINPTPEEVFANLPMLYETVQEKAFGEVTGNSYRFMPKHYKAMVMRLVAPEYYPDVKISYSKQEDGTLTGVCAEAKLFLNQADGRPVATGKQYLSFNAIEETFKDESDRRSYVESTVRGIALSKAYQEFGIGSWYTYRFEPEENPNAILAAMSDGDMVNPTVAYGDDGVQHEAVGDTENGGNSESTSDEQKQPVQEMQDQETASPAQDTDAKSDGQAAKSPEENTPEENTPETESDKADSKNKGAKTAKGKKTSGSPLDAARSRKAPLGKAADMNLTLGETETIYPGNIFWLYMQPSISSEDKDALKLIALNNPTIKNMFEDRGIKIS